MKINKISNKLLKYMVSCFHENGKDCFNFIDIKNTFHKVKEHELIASIYNLKSNHLVSVSSYDNEPSIIILNVKAISKLDEDTLMKKGYNLAKEIKSFH